LKSRPPRPPPSPRPSPKGEGEEGEGAPDVIVIGAGLAGLAAAIEAAKHGARVTLLEKQEAPGGSTIMSGGSFAFADSDEQRAAGLVDSPQALRDDLLKVGAYANDTRLVDAYVANQAETYAWLKSVGVTFPTVFAAGGQSVPRSHRTDPKELIRLLHAAARATGAITIETGCRVRRLATDSGGAKVTGVVLEDAQGHERHIEAARGVVIASGGFSRNEELLAIFAPAQKNAQRMGGAGNTGDGLLMAWKLGAGVRDMGFIKGTFGSHPTATPDEYKPLLAIYRGAIAVNKSGRRFVNEAISYKVIGDRCLEQEGAIAFQVFDQPVFDLSDAGVPAFDIHEAYEAGRIVRANTLTELATKLGVDAQGLQGTVAAYNRDIPHGRDSSFGRVGLSNEDFGTLTPIETAPFYGYPCTSVVLATYCGLAVDDGMRVLDVFGEPIEGLYAAGEVVGGLHGAAYMSSSANGKAAIFGRLAGRGAARFTGG
jgi:fumarate reductase flavoprotein subunit